MCHRSRCSSWSARRSVSDARCCDDRWPVSSCTDVFDAAGIDAQRRPEELDVDRVGRTAPRHGWRPRERDVVVEAPAKLTLSLRITGVRADGYHLIDAEMVTLDWHDTVTIDPSSTGLTADGPYATGMPLDESNLVAAALRHVGRTAAVHVHKALPHGGGLGGGSADAAAVLRWAGYDDVERGGRAGGRRRLLPRRRTGPCARHRRTGRAVAVRADRRSRWSFHRCRSAPRRLSNVG